MVLVAFCREVRIAGRRCSRGEIRFVISRARTNLAFMPEFLGMNYLCVRAKLLLSFDRTKLAWNIPLPLSSLLFLTA